MLSERIKSIQDRYPDYEKQLADLNQYYRQLDQPGITPLKETIEAVQEDKQKLDSQESPTHHIRPVSPGRARFETSENPGGSGGGGNNGDNTGGTKLEEKKLVLEKYRMEFRKLQGEINAMLYRANSRGAGYDEQRAVNELKAKRREKVAGLERDFEISLQQIPVQILVYEDELIAIQLQLEGADIEHTHFDEQHTQQQSVPDREGLENTGNQPASSPLRQNRSDDLEDGLQNAVSRTRSRGGRER